MRRVGIIGVGLIGGTRALEQAGCPPHRLRVTVGLPEHNRRFLEALEQVLER